MAATPRYAIYFVPAAHRPLYRFGCAVLGYDCYSGEEVAHPKFGKLTPAEWEALTREARPYGFHATLKAPFRLQPSVDEAMLMEEFTAFAGLDHDIPVIEPCVGTLGAFIAIVPQEPCPVLDELAARCVAEFDHFRAPLTAEERDRRLASGLNAAEIANLDRWGYPFVFSSFRFHMTLTGPVAPERREDLRMLMQRGFDARCGGRPVPVGRLALLRQDSAQSRFRVLVHAALAAPDSVIRLS